MTEKVEAAREAITVAKDGLMGAANDMASGAASEISNAASSLANAGSKWAYVWMAQRIASDVLSTLISIVFILAIAYVVIYFMRKFMYTMKSVWCSKEFVDKVSGNVKSQIAIDNTKLLEDASSSNQALQRKFTSLSNRLDGYQFEPIREKLDNVLHEYKIALRRFDTRLSNVESMLEKVVLARAQDKKRK